MTHVAFHDPLKGFRLVAGNIKGANGITAEKPGDRVFVSALTGGVTPHSPPSSSNANPSGNPSIPTQRHWRLKIHAKNRSRFPTRQSMYPPSPRLYSRLICQPSPPAEISSSRGSPTSKPEQITTQTPTSIPKSYVSPSPNSATSFLAKGAVRRQNPSSSPC